MKLIFLAEFSVQLFLMEPTAKYLPDLITNHLVSLCSIIILADNRKTKTSFDVTLMNPS